MVRTTARYDGELRCTATHGPSGTVLSTDAPVDNQGRGESYSPTDLCATALATCMATIMGIVARREGIDLGGMSFEVNKEMSAEAPRRIVRLPVEFWVPADPTAEQKATLVAAAEGCPVARSLDPAIEKPLTVHWGERRA